MSRIAQYAANGLAALRRVRPRYSSTLSRGNARAFVSHLHPLRLEWGLACDGARPPAAILKAEVLPGLGLSALDLCPIWPDNPETDQNNGTNAAKATASLSVLGSFICRASLAGPARDRELQIQPRFSTPALHGRSRKLGETSMIHHKLPLPINLLENQFITGIRLATIRNLQRHHIIIDDLFRQDPRFRLFTKNPHQLFPDLRL